MRTLNRNLLVAVALTSLLAACGGATGEPPTASADPGAGTGSSDTGGGGAGGTPGSGTGGGGTSFAIDAFSRGTVTELSPLTVNGVRFDTSEAEVRIEGEKRGMDELRKGQVVRVRGTISGRAGRAATVSFDDDLRGRVDDRTAGRLGVGGQEVEIEHGTEFEDEVRREDSIQPGDRVRVSGHRTATGAIRATRIEKDAGTGEDFEVKGWVADLDAAAASPTFSLRMSPDGAAAWRVTLAAGAVLPDGIRDGSLVEVRSTASPSSGALAATSVTLEDADGEREDDGAEVEGIVTNGTSAAFSVADRRVSTTATTIWEYGLPEDLVAGAKVEVEGRVDAQGAIVARKVSFRSSVRLQGAATNVVTAGMTGGSFQVLGITVRVDSLTEWSSSGGASLSLPTVGSSRVRVRGRVSRDGTEVVATRVEATGDDRPLIQGPAAAKDSSAGTVTILGVVARSGPRTEFQPSGAAAFFDAVVPGATVVKARGKEPADFADGTLLADQLEIEDRP